MTLADIDIEQFKRMIDIRPRMVDSIDKLAKELQVNHRTAVQMIKSGFYDKAIHHLIGRNYLYNVDKFLELSLVSKTKK